MEITSDLLSQFERLAEESGKPDAQRPSPANTRKLELSDTPETTKPKRRV